MTVLGVIVLILVSKLLSLAPTFIVGRTIDLLTEGHFSLVWWALGGILFLAGAQVLFVPWQERTTAAFVQRTVLMFSRQCAVSIFAKHYRLFETSNVGGLIKRSERGIEGLEAFLTFLIKSSVPALASMLIISVSLFMIAGWQILTLLGLATLTFVVLSHGVIRWRRRFIDAVNAAEDDMAETYGDSFLAAKSVKAAGAVRTMLNGLNGLNAAFAAYADKAAKLAFASGVLTASQKFVAAATSVAAIAIATLAMIQGDGGLSVGQFVIIFNFVGAFMLSVGQLMDLRKHYDQHKADTSELEKILASPPMRPPSYPLKRLAGDLTVHPFQTIDGAALTLDQPLTFQPGQHGLITGETGAGKSTLLEVAASVQTISGAVTVGGTDLAAVAYQSVTDHIFYAPQRPVFLEGDFQRAVLFGQAVDRQRLARLMGAIGLGKFDTLLDADTFKTHVLSGGEQKRFALLRCLVAPQPVILLDEPTSEIDAAIAHSVWRVIFAEMAGKTLLCASHDLSHQEKFDTKITIANGTVGAMRV